MTKAAELAKMGEVLTNSQISGRRNIVINGAMQVAQRATSATGVGGSSGFHTLDRMNIASGTTAGRATMSQSTDAPTGFANSLKLDCTTDDTAIAADESFIIEYKIEGQDVQRLKKGTSDAEKVTLSFYVKGNANATYTAELLDNDNTRYNSQEFSVTTSWTRVTLTYDGDTTGTLGNDIEYSLGILFWLHAGATFTGGTHTDNSWHTTANQRVGDNQTSFFDSTDREFYITGIQLEVGSVATPFEHRTLAEELLLCQRYYQKFVFVYFNLSRYYHNTGARLNDIHFYTEMRDTPVGTNSGTFTSSTGFLGNPTIYSTDTRRAGIGGGSGSANSVIYLNSGSGAFLQMDAEL